MDLRPGARLALLTCGLVIPPAAVAQQEADPALLAEISRIPAIDNHSHDAPASAPEDEPRDPIGSVPFAYPLRLRLDNPEYADAWAGLWGTPVGPDQAKAALRAKWRARREKGESYPSWVLQQAGIECALVSANRLGPGQAPPHFRWVPVADELLFPLQNRSARFRQILAEAGLSEPPSTLGRYVSQVLTPTLTRWKRNGAVAVKLAVAYRRPLDFAKPTEEDAERVYGIVAEAAAGTDGTPAGRKTLQDYLFHLLSAEAGRLGLVVHIHTGVGAAPYFNLAGSNPSLLEPALNDPALRETRFVLVHGGWPFDRETGVMLIKPNVYADFSAQTFLRSTHALAQTLQGWLEWYPEKVLFGTDAYSEELMGATAPLSGWEEKTWLAARTSREALALALTRMIREGQISPARASELAGMVLRGNAERLYGWATPEK